MACDAPRITNRVNTTYLNDAAVHPPEAMSGTDKSSSEQTQ